MRVQNRVLTVADKLPSPRIRVALVTHTRSVLFWAVVIAAVSIGVLFAGSQIARDNGQSVDWYTGFGQWLGALGSFTAAGAALWISTSDRRHTMADRRRATIQQDADLKRQAGLVRVTAEMLNRRQPVGPGIALVVRQNLIGRTTVTCLGVQHNSLAGEARRLV